MNRIFLYSEQEHSAHVFLARYLQYGRSGNFGLRPKIQPTSYVYQRASKIKCLHNTKTDVTHAIYSRDFVAQIYRTSCSAQLCMSHTATMSHKPEIINQLGQCLFMRQSCSVRHAHQLHAATLSRDTVALQNRAKNRRCDIVLTVWRMWFAFFYDVQHERVYCQKDRTLWNWKVAISPRVS